MRLGVRFSPGAPVFPAGRETHPIAYAIGFDLLDSHRPYGSLGREASWLVADAGKPLPPARQDRWRQQGGRPGGSPFGAVAGLALLLRSGWTHLVSPRIPYLPLH